MDILVQTTFLILILFAIINLVISTSLYIIQKKEVFAWMSIFWITIILNFIIQSFAQDGHLRIIVSYGFAVIPLNLLGYVSLKFLKLNYPIKKMGLLSIFALVLTYLLNHHSISFFLKALPFTLATAAPLLFVSYVFLFSNRKQSSAIMKTEATVLLLMAIHCFNFALFRNNPGSQLWGWSLSYALYQLLACLLPALLIDDYYREEKSRQTEIVNQRIEELHYLLEQKNTMVKVLTHDISNCLIPLNFFTKILKEKKVDELNQEEFSKALHRIEVSSTRISSMVTQVRDFESMANRKNQSHLKNCYLKSSLEESLSHFREQLQAKNISYKIKFDNNLDSHLRVIVDPPSFVNSVLSNLISNSIKFSYPDSLIEINILAAGENKVEIQFKDNGIGMSEEMVSNVFSFSHNISRDGTNGEKGTGFGLPILKKYIEIYEGEISVISKEQTSYTSGFTCFKLVLKTIKN